MNQEINRHAMSRGLILGSVFAVNYVLSTFQVTSFLTFGIQIVVVYMIYKMAVDCRENVLEGVISYGRCWWYVVNLFLYSSMVAGVFKYIYLKMIRPNYLSELMKQVEDILEQTNLSKSVMNESMTSLNQLLTPENMALYSIMGDVFLGVLLGLVIAAIVKRDESYRHEEME